MHVLDTHTLLWWVNGSDRLSNRAKTTIETTQDEGSEILISAISIWEIAMLVKKERLYLNKDIHAWTDQVNDIEGLRFISIDKRIAAQATLLPGDFHKDPADRMIVATARTVGAPLISADRKIQAYPHVETVW